MGRRKPWEFDEKMSRGKVGFIGIISAMGAQSAHLYLHVEKLGAWKDGAPDGLCIVVFIMSQRWVNARVSISHVGETC